MKYSKVLKGFISWLLTAIVETVLSLIFKDKLMKYSEFINNHFVEFLLIILISTLILILAIKFVGYVIKSIRMLKLKCKVYDIMIVKFYDHSKSLAPIIGITNDDLALFDEKEIILFKKHIQDIERYKILKKGSNKTFNSFGKYD